MKVTIPFLDLNKMYNSGQQFTWTKISDNTYSIIHKTYCLFIRSDYYVEITDLGNNEFELTCSEEEFKSVWYSYFDLDTDYEFIWEKVMRYPNSYLQDAAYYGYGIRILKQDFWDTVITFIISQNNNMKRIRKSIDALREKYGHKPYDNNTNLWFKFNTFPNAMELSIGYKRDQYKDCGLGYRDVYVKEATNKEVDLLKLKFASLDYESLIKELKTFKGIGDKVANCIALYGLHYLEAAPIDTHMKRIINEHFDGTNLLNDFQGYQGLVQQWLFDYETNINKKKK